MVLVVFAAEALAVDLVNRDSGGYEIEVTSSNGASSTSIGAASVRRNVCSSNCQIVVRGIGSIQASGNDIVIIEGGSLSKRSQ